MNGQASAPSTPAATGTSFVTRDCVHFRHLKSPLSAIANRFFNLLASEGTQGQSARRCFAHSALDHPLTSDAEYTLDFDNQIREAFRVATPSIVLIQGAFRPDNVLSIDPADFPAPGTPNSVSTLGSFAPNATAGPTSFADVVFASFTLHNEYQRCVREDKEQASRLAWYFLLVLAHESSHWLFTRVHGFNRDPMRPSQRAVPGNASPGSSMSRQSSGSTTTAVSIHGQKIEDPLITLGQNRDDCGARTTDMLFGSTGAIVTFADGDADVVKRKVLPEITKAPPVWGAKDIEALTGHKLAQQIDVTGSPSVLIGGPTPKWSVHDAYLVTSKVTPNSLCQHGMCRIGKLF